MSSSNNKDVTTNNHVIAMVDLQNTAEDNNKIIVDNGEKSSSKQQAQDSPSSSSRSSSTAHTKFIRGKYDRAKHYVKMRDTMKQIRNENDSAGERFWQAATNLFTINKGLSDGKDTAFNKRPPNTLKKKLMQSYIEEGTVQDHHLLHAGITVRHGERCCHCGPACTGSRVKMFHRLESHRFQGGLRILLLVDLLIVILEILYKYRVGIFYPSGGLDTDAASKYTPAYGVCSQVRNDAQFTECCKDMETIYGQFNPFTSVEDCKFQHLNASTVHPSKFGSGSGGHRVRRMLLASSSHHDTGPRCYEHPWSFAPHFQHYWIETALHYVGFSICMVFFIEVNLLAWSITGCRLSRCGHMFCNCNRMIRIGDRVKVKEHVKIQNRENLKLLKTDVVYCVRHKSPVSGFVDLFEDESHTDILDAIPNVSRQVIELVHKSACPCPIEWNAMWYALDYVIVSISSYLELITLARYTTGDPDFGGFIFASLFMLSRFWRFIRVGHGIIEARHKYQMAISEGNEFEHDVRDVLDEIDALKTDLLAKELSIEEFGDKVNRVFAEFLEEYPEEIGDEEAEQPSGGHGPSEFAPKKGKTKRDSLLLSIERTKTIHEISLKYQPHDHHH